MRLIFGQDGAVAEWTARRIPHMADTGFRDFVAIGVAEGDRPIAGIVYTEFIPAHRTIMLSAAASTPRWAQRGVIRALLHYPFMQLNVNKVWTATPHRNERAIRFNLGIGFTKEAVLGHHFGDQHAVICRMYRQAYIARYLNGEDRGQEIPVAARRA